MKQIVFWYFIFFSILEGRSQSIGVIRVEGNSNKSGSYIYSPPKKLLIPDSIEVLILYQDERNFKNVFIPIKKRGNEYRFSFKTPDSALVLIMGIVNAKRHLKDYDGLMIPRKKLVDNNNESGYIFYTDSAAERSSVKLQLAGLLNNKAHWLELKIDNYYLLSIYDEAYKSKGNIKYSKNYTDYMILMCQTKKDSFKNELVSYADGMSTTGNNEIELNEALRVYRFLKMEEERLAVEKKIVENFPNGQFAKDLFWKTFYKKNKNTSSSIINDMDNYIKLFKDTSNDAMDRFYQQLISGFFNSAKFDSIIVYEKRISNKVRLSACLNQYAAELCGISIDSIAKDLKAAKLFSDKAIRYLIYSKNEKHLDSEEKYFLKATYNIYLSTYALIHFKLKNYDSAFFYQNIVYSQPDAINVQGLEQYAIYAERSKGLVFTKRLIEKELLSGINSVSLINQLKNIYKKLHISESKVEELQAKSDAVLRNKIAMQVKLKYGTTKAKDFTLKNLNNEVVSLSMLKGKVVILDFWATWCIPCRAEFPEMKKMIEKYKNETDIVFLFVNVWENTTNEKMKEAAASIMAKDNYDFNVLLDVTNSLINMYKVTAIPVKFVIDKKGDIVFSGETANLEEVIQKVRTQN